MIEIFVTREEESSEQADAVFHVDRNLYSGERDFAEIVRQPTTLETDLLLIAASIFAADRVILRGEGDDYARRLHLRIPVVNGARLSPLVRDIERSLRRLSNDSWRIDLLQVTGSPERAFSPPRGEGATLLFSGGLDSLAAALDLTASRTTTQLVSHRTRNTRTDTAQRTLVDQLRGIGRTVIHRQVFVSSADRGLGSLKHDAENSQRTRSFVFLVLGALFARRAGHERIVFLAENGQLAVNLPLTRARIGAFSTYTAHPDFIARMQRVLSTALEWPLVIQNPFLYETKAEVVRRVLSALPTAVGSSNSCWRNARLPAAVTHCGVCVPCLVRRIAIEYTAGADATAYGTDPWGVVTSGADENEEGVRNTGDLAKFVMSIATLSTDDIFSEWPDLHSNNMDGGRVIEMYRRFCGEAQTVMRKYPSLEHLLR